MSFVDIIHLRVVKFVKWLIIWIIGFEFWKPRVESLTDELRWLTGRLALLPASQKQQPCALLIRHFRLLVINLMILDFYLNNRPRNCIVIELSSRQVLIVHPHFGDWFWEWRLRYIGTVDVNSIQYLEMVERGPFFIFYRVSLLRHHNLFYFQSVAQRVGPTTSTNARWLNHEIV